jgi:hypothetical protein
MIDLQSIKKFVNELNSIDYSPLKVESYNEYQLNKNLYIRKHLIKNSKNNYNYLNTVIYDHNFYLVDCMFISNADIKEDALFKSTSYNSKHYTFMPWFNDLKKDFIGVFVISQLKYNFPLYIENTLKIINEMKPDDLNLNSNNVMDVSNEIIIKCSNFRDLLKKKEMINNL